MIQSGQHDITQKFHVRHKHLWHHSVVFYLILMNIILLGLLFPSTSLLFLNEITSFREVQLNRIIEKMHADIKLRSASLVRSIALSAGQAVAGYDFTLLNVMVQRLVSNDPEIIYAMVVDTDRRAVAHSISEKIGTLLEGERDYEVLSIIQDRLTSIAGQSKRSTETVVEFMDNPPEAKASGIRAIEVFAPVFNGDQFWGVFRCGYSLQKFYQETETFEQQWSEAVHQFKIHSISITLIFFILGILIASLFTHFFVRAVRMLSDGVHRVAQGNLTHRIASKNLFCSEFIGLSESFNVMTRQLESTYHQLGDYSKSLEHKIAERTQELKETQAILLKQAHDAGMAEMAVGILHNIGNAITPAMVDSSLLLKRLDRSPVHLYLTETFARLKEIVKHCDLPVHERTRLIEILKLLPESIRNEYNLICQDLKKIRDKHEHIEGIIRLQLGYARIFDDFEEINLNQIVEDALEMLEDSIRKRAIDVEKNFSELPLIKFSKAKLIQIIINLIKNGYEAMDGMMGDRKLILTTFVEERNAKTVALSVRDMGIGFSPAEKDSLFAFGYTTKATGSGFGLHSVANQIIASGGSIGANSDGPGMGAEFIIHLPVLPEKNNTNH